MKTQIFNTLLETVSQVCEVSAEDILSIKKAEDVVDARTILVYFCKDYGLHTTMMNYRQMVDAAVKGGSGEKAMWASIDVTNELMEYLEYKDPATFEKFMRKSYEAMCGKHYNRYFAEEDVAKLHYTDKDGKEHHGAYWTIEQIKEATAEKKFPQGTTDWDKYVAYNAAYADFSKKFEDGDILCIAWLFFFADEDWKGDGKVWEYMSMNK